MAPEVLVIVLLATTLAAPHVLPLERVAPSSAAAVWFLALCLRAVTAVGAAFYLLTYFPQTDRFVALSDWCFHHNVLSIQVHLPGTLVVR
ncbi:MAG TPA: hypothetical protein VN606_17845, partial [Thermoleophilaceae bacterium]|nr:hypothetical protein [Thermoleophilaceae bacterium]